MISVDALFGRPRKKCAGISFRQPLHGMLYFENQDEVDLFVEPAPRVKRQSNKVIYQCLMQIKTDYLILGLQWIFSGRCFTFFHMLSCLG